MPVENRAAMDPVVINPKESFEEESESDG